MKMAYPVILRKSEEGYLVEIPGFDINTFGATKYEAIEMARDAIGVAGIDKLDHGETLPKLINQQELKTISGEDLVSFVDIDFDRYRNELDTRLIRKNVTIPYYLNVKAEKMGLNFSKVLREAVSEYIVEYDGGKDNDNA